MLKILEIKDSVVPQTSDGYFLAFDSSLPEHMQPYSFLIQRE